jgi:hypothetical protein
MLDILWNEKRMPKNERKPARKGLLRGYLLNSKQLFLVRPRPQQWVSLFKPLSFTRSGLPDLFLIPGEKKTDKANERLRYQ